MSSTWPAGYWEHYTPISAAQMQEELVWGVLSYGTEPWELDNARAGTIPIWNTLVGRGFVDRADDYYRQKVWLRINQLGLDFLKEGA